MLKELTELLSNGFLWMLLGAGVAVLIWLRLKKHRKVQRQSRILGSQLRDIGELAVEEARVTLVHCTKEPRRFFGKELPLMRERCIFTVDAIVRIGFDLSEVNAEVSNLHRTITLNLPFLRVLSSAVDYESMTVFDEKTGVFARPRLEWHRESMLHLTREAEEKVRAAGVFERAKSSAKTHLRAFVDKLYDLTEYTLEIRIAEAPPQEEPADSPESSQVPAV